MKCIAMYPVKLRDKIYPAGKEFECTKAEFEALNQNGAMCTVVEGDKPKTVEK